MRCGVNYIFLPENAISLTQPWAWAVFHGMKILSFSHQAISVHKFGDNLPNRVAVHASVVMTQKDYATTRLFLGSKKIDCPRPDKLERGAIIGAVTLVRVEKNPKYPWQSKSANRGIHIAEAEECVPIGCGGASGLFHWGLPSYSGPAYSQLSEPAKWMIAWPEKARHGINDSAEVKEKMQLLPLF